MDYSAKVNVNGKTYNIAFTPATGTVYCVNCETLRYIKSAKTLATIYAAWADQDHAEALEMNAQRDTDSATGLETILEKFKAVAPGITRSVAVRVTAETSDAEIMVVIHEEIAHHFEAFNNMTAQYLAFNADQRREFAGIMYDLLAPTAQNVKATLNPVYEKFVTETGKSGALNFICHQLENKSSTTNTPAVISGKGYNEEYAQACGQGVFHWVKVQGSQGMDGYHEFGTKAEVDELVNFLTPAPIYRVYQRADGMQLAVSAEGTASFMRPFKQASWLRAGFEANLEYYWLVEKSVSINTQPSEVVFFHDGVLTTCPV